jgi:hypothetical protein
MADVLVGHIRPTGFVQPSSGSRVIAPLLDRIYPTQPNLSQFESLIGHIRSRSDISDVLTALTASFFQIPIKETPPPLLWIAGF